MAKFYRNMVITFNDGTTATVGGNEHSLIDGTVLSVYTVTDYASIQDRRNYPIANIREYHWENR